MKIRNLSTAAIIIISLFLVTSCVDDELPVTTGPPIPVPGIEFISPASGFVADTVTITGINFGAISSQNSVNFDTVEVKIVNEENPFIKWSDEEIQLRVPEGVPFGDIKVTVTVLDSISNEVDFTVLQPTLPEIEMVNIPAGTFRMGDISGAGFDNELPVHDVEITRPFLMSKFEISQTAWEAISSINPSPVRADSLPVTRVTWWDAVYFCNWLSEQKGLEKCYEITESGIIWNKNADGYRLPTEAEWEYACRAGAETPYYSGSSEEDLQRAAWFYGNMNFEENSSVRPSGLKEANDFGLHDMHGNAAEWCWDWWTENYENAETVDPDGPDTGFERVIRGGAWTSNAGACRSAFRFYRDKPHFSRYYHGCRVVRDQ